MRAWIAIGGLVAGCMHAAAEELPGTGAGTGTGTGTRTDSDSDSVSDSVSDSHSVSVSVSHSVSVSASTVIWIAGDVLIDGAIRRAAERTGEPAQGFASMLAPVARHWNADDATVIVNMESPTARERVVTVDNVVWDRSHRIRPVPLNAPRWTMAGLKLAGVDVVDLANNHVLDQRREGLADTLDAAEAAGLEVVGAGRAPHTRVPITVGVEGAKTAVLAFFEKDYPEPRLPDGVAGVSCLDDQTFGDIEAAAATHDAVVVLVHVFGEFSHRLKPGWPRWAERMVAAGADAIVVHGQHVVAPIARIRGGGREAIVAWGIGNLISDLGAYSSPSRTPRRPFDRWHDPRAREGLAVRLELVPRPGAHPEVRASFLPFFVHHDRWLVDNDRREPPPRFWVTPLAACGRAIHLDEDWPEGWREGMLRFAGERRDHLLEVSGLRAEACVPCGGPGCASLLPAP